MPPDRTHEFWTPELIWRGQTAFILASGPSMTQAVADQLRDRNVIVINASFVLAPWAPVWFFHDTTIFEMYREAVETWPGMIVTMSNATKRALPDKVKRVRGEWMPGFPPPGSLPIRQGRSSGQTAISLAVAMGTTRIVLCGFDLRVVDGHEHHHDEYRDQKRDLRIYVEEFIPAFASWNKQAQAIGVEIINATPGSALMEFPMIDLSTVIGNA